MPPRLQRVLRPALAPGAAVGLDSTGHSRARACKVFDGNLNGTADGGEQLVAGWKFRLSDDHGGSSVRTTGEDGCALFTDLQTGSYALSEIVPPQWPATPAPPRAIQILAPRGRVQSAAQSTLFVGGCIQFARMGSATFWRGEDGVQLMDERDRQSLNELEPFRSPPGRSAVRAPRFDGRFADGLSPARGADRDRAVWAPVAWQRAVSLYLGDASISADPHGRLAQEILTFVLNTRHLLDHAEMVYVEGMPLFVDDLLFEGIIAWQSGAPAWMRDMTGLLATVNGTAVLPYVPHHHCQVAYLPF